MNAALEPRVVSTAMMDDYNRLVCDRRERVDEPNRPFASGDVASALLCFLIGYPGGIDPQAWDAAVDHVGEVSS